MIILDIKNLTLEIESNGVLVKALDKVSLTIQENEIRALVGESGSGKSTIVHLLLGLYAPTEGEIFVNNIAFKDLNLGQWRENVAMVNQNPYLYDMSIKDNIKFGYLDASEDLIINSSKASLAHDFIMKMPDLECYLLYSDENGEIQKKYSSGFEQFMVK